MVMCGEWVCGDGGKWDFVIDKQQMARLVTLYDGIGLMELQANVLREFGVEDCLFVASLSYWAPSSLETATGINTPPVLITSDGAIKYFLQHLRAKGNINMFVRFEKKTREEEIIDDSGMGFVTPASFRSKACSKSGSVSKSRGFGSVSVSRTFGSGSTIGGSGSGSASGRFVSGTLSRCFSSGTVARGSTSLDAPPPAVNLEDVEFIHDVEKVEAAMKKRNASGKEKAFPGSGVVEDEVVKEID